MDYKRLRKEVKLSFSKSSGSGGQNINKVNTKVTLKWDLLKTRLISSEVKKRILKKHSRQVVNGSQLVVKSQRFRLQARNISDCFEKLVKIINLASVAPKKRKATRPTKSSVEKRLKDKKIQSEKKKMRKDWD